MVFKKGKHKNVNVYAETREAAEGKLAKIIAEIKRRLRRKKARLKEGAY